MSVVVGSLIGNSNSKLQDAEFRLRADLQWIEQVRNGESTWVARDPLTLDFFYFSNLERQFLLLIDRYRSIDAALEQLQSSSIPRQWAEQLLGRLSSMGLLIKQGDLDRGQRLWMQTQNRTKGLLLESLLNPLSVRVKLLNPNKIIEMLDGVSWILFNRWSLVIVAMLVPVLAYLISIRLLSSKFSLIQEATIHWNWQMGLQLMLAYALIKSLHEMGHALACRYHRVSCHEVGILFLLFVPCLYCDTSDSWRLSSRWQRAAIAAAGIYVELIVGLLAGLLWLSTHTESVLHQVSGAILVSATISTLMVNANPLMRYDGYYVLADLWGVPNLAQQSTSALQSNLARLLLGEKTAPSSFDASSWLLAGYAIAAKCYQTLAMFLIVIAAWTLMERAGFRLGGVILLSLLIARLTAAYMTVLRNLMRVAAGHSWLRRARVTIVTSLLFASGCWGMFFLELPTWVAARGVCEYEHLKPLFASETGTLVTCLDTRKPVGKGELIAELRSIKFELEIQRIEAEIRLRRELLEQLRLDVIYDDRAAERIGEVSEQIAKHTQLRSSLVDQLSKMKILADQSGTFIPSHIQANAVLSQSSDRSGWRPILQQENLGCTIERGTILGWMAFSNELRVVAYVHHSDLETVSLGMKARVRMDGFADQIVDGIVTKVAPEPLSQTPGSLIGDESFVSQSSFAGELKPNVPHYEVHIRLVDQPSWLVHQSVATVHIATPPRTIWQSIVRQLELNVRPNWLL